MEIFGADTVTRLAKRASLERSWGVDAAYVDLFLVPDGLVEVVQRNPAREADVLVDTNLCLPFVGGMSGPGGIGLRDTASPAAIDGASPLSVQAHWLRLINAAYGANVSGVRQPDADVAMAAWDALVADPRYGLTVARNAALDEAPGAVVKDGLAIVSIRTVDPRAGAAGRGAAPVTWTAKV